MSKLNIVRQIKNKNIKKEDEYEKENKWNNRFHLAKLPPYDSHHDTNCKIKKIKKSFEYKISQRSNKNV